jgi:hypothetical protein
MFKIPLILVGLGAALVLSPACKALEASPDHFTESGVPNVYESAPGKVVAPKVRAEATRHTSAHAPDQFDSRNRSKAHSCILCATTRRGSSRQAQGRPEHPEKTLFIRRFERQQTTSK